jgi:hypothetical protein
LIGTLSITKERKTNGTTKADKFSIYQKCEATFVLPAFHKHGKITWNCYVYKSASNTNIYDFINGKELMREIGLDICFSIVEMIWGNALLDV